MARVTLRAAVAADVRWFEFWDQDGDVVRATTDDPHAARAFAGVIWADELAAQSTAARYYIAEIDGHPIGALQIIDPHLEPTHYWGEIAPNLRAIDIWIGTAADRNRGSGREMMQLAFDICFADPNVTAVVIDPLASNTRAHRFYERLGFRPIGRRAFGMDDCLVHELTRADWETKRGH